MIVLCANRLFTPLEEIFDPLVFIEDGIISEISSRATRDIPNNATLIDCTREISDAILAPRTAGPRGVMSLLCWAPSLCSYVS